MQLTVISGRSGSGKSTALAVLEDADYYCIDNLPAGLIPGLLEEMGPDGSLHQHRVAVCIDARNSSADLSQLPKLLALAQIDTNIVYLDASDAVLTQRFSETRRKHPLSNKDIALQDALVHETIILEPLANGANTPVDTTGMTYHDLRSHISDILLASNTQTMSVLFQSFGFKNGVPMNADLVFDLRCLPNPHWNDKLRALTGKDEAVIQFLENQSLVNDMYRDIERYVDNWLPHYLKNQRAYTTVALGCTGGKHRSVYMAQRLQTQFSQQFDNTQVRHRDLPIKPGNQSD